MATPPCMVELSCPKCQRSHWTIDHDYRGAALVGERELAYEERSYTCPLCNAKISGYSVEQKSPPHFLLQPHDLYPMTEQEFANWLSIFRAHFPENDRLGTVGVYWYPGKRKEDHETQLSLARNIDLSQKCQYHISNRNPHDKRIRVCVQGKGEAHFWVNSTVELDCCYFGFDAEDLEKIRELLRIYESKIREAWDGFSTYAKHSQAKWLAILERDETV